MVTKSASQLPLDLHSVPMKESICLQCKSLLIDDVCVICEEVSLRCEVCKSGFFYRETISACPECNFQFHFNHFRASILIYGVCPVCKSSVSFRKIEGSEVLI